MAMDKENLFNAPLPPYPHFTSQNHHEIAALSRRFSRSASIHHHHHHPLYILKEKKSFSGTPESGLGWPASTHSSPPPPPFVKSDEEEAWNLIYAAAEHVARMKMKLKMINTATATAAGASYAIFRQPHFSHGHGGGVRSPSLPRSAWPPPKMSAVKPTVAGGSAVAGCGGATAGKRECAGTGVFLPRSYCNKPPESRKRQACSPANVPARMIQSSTSSMVPIGIPPVNGGQQRRSSTVHGGVMVVDNNPEMMLPQEWTY